MHLLTNTTPIDMGPFGILAPGEWLCSDTNAFELAMLADRGTVKVDPMRGPSGIQGNSELFPLGGNLLVRSGAWGDLLFLTPVLKAIKEKYPSATLSLANFPVHHCLFEGTELLDTIVSYPMPILEIKDKTSLISLENCMELGGSIHATDTFAKACGVEVTDYKPVYVVSDKELQDAMTAFPTGKKPRLGLHMHASVVNRNYPLPQWMKVAGELIKRGWEIMVLGTEHQIGEMKETATFKKVALDFRASAAVLKTCDAFAGVDSVWLHMCHALDIPAVGLFGPIPWQARTSKAPLTTAISGVGDCAPCFWHAHAGRHFPLDKPCTKVGYCTVLASIEPERVVSKIDQLKPK